MPPYFLKMSNNINDTERLEQEKLFDVVLQKMEDSNRFGRPQAKIMYERATELRRKRNFKTLKLVWKTQLAEMYKLKHDLSKSEELFKASMPEHVRAIHMSKSCLLIVNYIKRFCM